MSRQLLSQVFELGDDRVSSGRPPERARIGAIPRYESIDAPGQLATGTKGATADRALRDQVEPSLDLIEPRGIGRCEVNVIARPASKPCWTTEGTIGSHPV